MRGFIAGFVAASALWGAAAAVYVLGVLDRAPAVAPEPQTADGSVTAAAEEPAPRRRRGRRRPSDRAAATGNAVTGDDLGEDLPREIDLGSSGGDEQLSGAQIDHAFGSAMGQIRRCLLLAPEDAELRGTVTFGMRIRPSGQVGAVRLSGPAALTGGEPGACMRRAASGLRFPSFDGTDMVVRYPVTFE